MRPRPTFGCGAIWSGTIVSRIGPNPIHGVRIGWATYRPALGTHKPEMLVRNARGETARIDVATAPAHNYIFGVDLQGEDIWVATAKGLSHGIRIKETSQK